LLARLVPADSFDGKPTREFDLKTTLPREFLPAVLAHLERAHAAFQKIFPGSIPEGQPIHTYYEPAHLFRADFAARSREAALASLDEFAPDFASFAKAIGLPGAEALPLSQKSVAELSDAIEADPERMRGENPAASFAHTVYSRMREKLQHEPIEDLRIDFEDGYGNRPDEEEDLDAAFAASEFARALNSDPRWPTTGIRIKSFSNDLCARSLRTLDIFVTELAAKAHGKIPKHFFITLPKIYAVDEVAALAEACSQIEAQLGFTPGTLRIELMAETAASIFNERGEVNLLPLVGAAAGRCSGVHFGTYDYTAGRNLTAPDQHMLHFACDFAREVMQVALAGSGVWLSDGGTNVLPIPPHRLAQEEGTLTERQISENRTVVYKAWKLHFDHVRHSLRNGYYQGWDLHPAQLPTRYAAAISVFLENLDETARRLRGFIDKTSHQSKDVADDAATGQGLLNHFRRAIRCGAVTLDEAQILTGLSRSELQTGSFAQILASRRA
jgi:citrate lyase beta subunit